MIKIYTFLLFFQSIINSSINSRKDLSITIYNDDYAIIKDTRDIAFDLGLSYLSIDDVAATIQSETVTFRPRNEGVKVYVLEQNFENNLVNKGGVLKKYLNKNISIYAKLVEAKVMQVTGKLLSYTPQTILQTTEGIQIFDSVQGIILPELPQGLLTTPTLVWKVNNPSKQSFSSDFQIAYKATGFSWKSDYTLILNQKQTLMDFAGWVTIENNSGKKYQNTRIKLIAGDVNTIKQSTTNQMQQQTNSAVESSPSQVTQKSFGDYHMYTIKRNVNINESSTKQIQFIPQVTGVKIIKYYKVGISTGGSSEHNLKAENMIKFINSKTNKLGLPLPKGTIRTFKQDESDGSLQFIGQDSISHTPKNQGVRIKIGNAFDIVVQKIVKSKTTRDNGSWNASLQLQITNHRNSSSTVIVQLSNSYEENVQIDWKQPEKLKKQTSSFFSVQISLAPGQKRALHWEENNPIKI